MFIKLKEYITLGECIPKSHQIIISDRVEKQTDKARILYHGIGHVVDIKNDVCGYYSSMLEFRENCFDKEKYSLQGHSKEYFFCDDIREYFAECYNMYILNHQYLERDGKNTLSFFDKITKERNAELDDATLKLKVAELKQARANTPASMLPIA